MFARRNFHDKYLRTSWNTLLSVFQQQWPPRFQTGKRCDARFKRRDRFDARFAAGRLVSDIDVRYTFTRDDKLFLVLRPA